MTETYKKASKFNFENNSSMLNSTFDKLLSETTPNFKFTEVKAELIKAKEKLSLESSNETMINADLYWTPLKLACNPNLPAKLRQVAVDSLQKLVAHKLLRGSAPLSKETNLKMNRRISVVNQSNKDTNVNMDIELINRPASIDQDSKDSQQFYLIDEIIYTVCNASPLASPTTNSSEDEVQLQIIKFLLTLLTTTTVEIHTNTLLRCIQTCFSIHLNSKNLVNQVTAKASLTQMINLIFSRMENYSQVLLNKLNVNLEDSRNLNEVNLSIAANNSLESQKDEKSKHRISDSELSPMDNKSPSLVGKSFATSNQNTEETSNDKDTEEVTRDNNQIHTSDQTEEPLEDRRKFGITDCKTNDPNLIEEKLNLEGGLKTEVDGKIEDKIMLGEKDDTEATIGDNIIESEAKVKENTKNLKKNGSSEANVNFDEKTHNTSKFLSKKSGNNPYDPTVAYYNELLRKDVYLSLRLLCKLSMHTGNTSHSEHNQTLNEGVNNLMNDELSQTSIRARVLALELILSVLNSAGPVLQNDDIYINLIRQHLCLTIARNGISTHPQLFELSLSVFLMILRLYRSKMVQEVEIILNTIYLHILEMGNSTYKQKSMVLQALLKICENPQTLLDIFINYDCNLSVVSIFERIVNVCAKCSQGGQGVAVPDDGNWTQNEIPAPAVNSGLLSYAASAAGLGSLLGDSKSEVNKIQEKKLKVKSLSCLVAIVNSLVEWSLQVAPALPVVGIGGKVTKTIPKTENVSIKASIEKPNSFLDAIVPTNQSNPVLVDRRPLNSISLVQFSSNLPMTPTGSNTALDQISHYQPTEVEEMASRKQLLKHCIKLFNTDPNAGIALLQTKGFVSSTPVSCARFLLTAQGLDKGAVGEYLGHFEPFNIKVMHSFIDRLNFKGVEFVSALRLFLQTFRLPGESQKIERILEKFADRYCETNPETFANADAAFILAFSIMMLNTDLHSAQVRSRMDKAAFIKNNKGINDNNNLPDEFLGSIFDEISRNEIVMEEEQAGQFATLAIGWGGADLENDKIRMENYRKEIALIQRKSHMLIRAAGTAGGNQNNVEAQVVFRSAVHADLARPMFAMSCWPMMATFSLLFEAAVDDVEDWDTINAEEEAAPKISITSEPKIADLCLQGFSGAIRVASLFRMETERDAFVSSMAKLTGLSHVAEMTPKNVKAIKTLFALANILGQYLEGSWVEVMKVVSSVERLQVAWNMSQDLINQGKNSSGGASQSGSRESLSGSRDDNASASIYTRRSQSFTRPDDLVLAFTSGKLPLNLSKVFTEVSSQSMAVLVDKIFSNTVGLSSNAIIHFFKALCLISLEEVGLESATAGQSVASTPNIISSPNFPNSPGIPGKLSAMSGPPRMYLLQKIVEIAHYNMHRIRYEWSQIWRILQPHFNTVACHPNVSVANFAVDSLRQLSMKFLERDELSHYETQREFLKSFEWIMRHNVHPAIRELILTSLSQIMIARNNNIKSGWKSIFVVLSKAATPPFHIANGLLSTKVNSSSLTMTSAEWEKLTKMSFEMIQVIFKNYVDAVSKAGAFVDLVSALAEFALLEGSSSTTIRNTVSVNSINVLGECGKWLSNQAELDKLARKTNQPPSQLEDATVPLEDSNKMEINHRNLNRRESSTTSLTARQLLSPYTLPNGLISEDHFFLKWFPLVSNMGKVITDSEDNFIQTEMIKILFETLKGAVNLFELKYWKSIHRSIILPIFEDFKENSNNRQKNSIGNSSNAIGNDNQTSEDVERSQSNSGVWPQALQKLVDLFALLLEKISNSIEGLELLESVFELIISMLSKRDEKLATTGQVCLQQFIQRNIGKFIKFNQVIAKDNAENTMELWEVVISAIERACWATSPAELLNCDVSSIAETKTESESPESVTIVQQNISNAPHEAFTQLTLAKVLLAGNKAYLKALSAGSSAKETKIVPITDLEELDLEHTIIKCATHLALMDGIKHIFTTKLVLKSPNSVISLDSPTIPDNTNSTQPVNYTINVIPFQYKKRILSCFYDSYSLARSFNNNLLIRQAIVKKRLMKNLPNLFKQETTSLHNLISLLFTIYRSEGDDSGEEFLEMLVTEILDVFERYVEFLNDQQKNIRDLNLWSPVIVLIFNELLNMDGWWKKIKNNPMQNSGKSDQQQSKGSFSNLEEAHKIVVCLRLKKHLSKFFTFGVKMMGADSPTVRYSLQRFMEVIGEEFIKFDE
ncbi:Brefeldin A-inhibited guanine nucleotide-exchange protein 2 [Lobulomyces angularis]|nr:Brefeldin A-inhibited guanine nucleotide-exchange protein 2 [Lobulomyces angularis]